MFSVSHKYIDPQYLKEELINPAAGAYVSFEGWVRNNNHGKEVVMLEYEVYESLAVKEGERIIAEARDKFKIADVVAVHRSGKLGIGDLAVYIGVTSGHRDEAYSASRYVIDQIKHRLPVWKKEYYSDGGAEWVFCDESHGH